MILILFLRINKICSNKRDSQAAEAAASAASVFLPWPGLSFRTTRANFKDGSTTDGRSLVCLLNWMDGGEELCFEC